MASLNSLPIEILDEIALLVAEDSSTSLCSLARSSKRLNVVATPLLYREVLLRNAGDDTIPGQIQALYNNPAQLFSFIRKVYVGLGQIRGAYRGLYTPFWRRDAFQQENNAPRDASTKSMVDLPPNWESRMKISVIIWRCLVYCPRLKNQWLIKLIVLNASTLTTLRMTIPPKSANYTGRLITSELPQRCEGLKLPNLREFVAYDLGDPYGPLQVYYILKAATYLREFSIFFHVDDPSAPVRWPWDPSLLPKGPQYPEMEGVTTLESFLELCLFSPLEKMRLRKVCISRLLVVTARMAEYLDTSQLKDLRISLCGDTVLFLSSLRGKLNLETFIVNDKSGDMAGINRFLITLPPGLKFLAYQVEASLITLKTLINDGSDDLDIELEHDPGNPYNGSEFPFSRDIIARNKDSLRYLSHTVDYKSTVYTQPPQQADRYFETRTSAYETLDLIELSIPIRMEEKKQDPNNDIAQANVHMPKSFVRLRRLRILNLVPSWPNYRGFLLWKIVSTNLARGEKFTGYAEVAYRTLHSIVEEAARLYGASDSRTPGIMPTLEWVIFGCIANTDRHSENTVTFRIKWHRDDMCKKNWGYYPEISYVPEINQVLRLEGGANVRLGETFMDSMYYYMDEPHRWRSG
ncbi:hypothetical protein TWF730_011274 [Orbilia blumenaviensis]|uniref:F-box domain-containing protein n=1 Tax=Orbilia blumenaviensis TaxID=1796055 RepID=A0AAV9UKT3_9PEZI